MQYILLYIVVSLIICYISSIIFIKVFLFFWNRFKSQKIGLMFTTKNIFMILIPLTFFFWIGLTLFILANLKMH